MIRLIISMAILIGVAGCAASAPDTIESSSSAAPGTATNMTARAESDSSATGDESVIEVVDLPALAKTETVAPRDELICHKERVTGTHRLEKICRFKSDIEEARKATQRTLREMDRGTSASANSN